MRPSRRRRYRKVAPPRASAKRTPPHARVERTRPFPVGWRAHAPRLALAARPRLCRPAAAVSLRDGRSAARDTDVSVERDLHDDGRRRTSAIADDVRRARAARGPARRRRKGRQPPGAPRGSEAARAVQRSHADRCRVRRGLRRGRAARDGLRAEPSAAHHERCPEGALPRADRTAATTDGFDAAPEFRTPELQRRQIGVRIRSPRGVLRLGRDLLRRRSGRQLLLQEGQGPLPAASLTTTDGDSPDAPLSLAA